MARHPARNDFSATRTSTTSCDGTKQATLPKRPESSVSASASKTRCSLCSTRVAAPGPQLRCARHLHDANDRHSQSLMQRRCRVVRGDHQHRRITLGELGQLARRHHVQSPGAFALAGDNNLARIPSVARDIQRRAGNQLANATATPSACSGHAASAMAIFSLDDADPAAAASVAMCPRWPRSPRASNSRRSA